jgi:hypothetical protein
MLVISHHHHHHQITKLSHSINAIGPAPHRGGRKREHRSIMFATITHTPSLHKKRRNAHQSVTRQGLATQHKAQHRAFVAFGGQCCHAATNFTNSEFE